MQKGRIRFLMWNDDLDRYIEVERKGKVFQVEEKELELFPASVMCDALSRTIQTLNEWHKKGIFPKPMFTLPAGESKWKKWYSKWQILNVQHIFRHQFGGITTPLSAEKLKKLQIEVEKVWYEMDFIEGVVEQQ